MRQCERGIRQDVGMPGWELNTRAHAPGAPLWVSYSSKLSGQGGLKQPALKAVQVISWSKIK